MEAKGKESVEQDSSRVDVSRCSWYITSFKPNRSTYGKSQWNAVVSNSQPYLDGLVVLHGVG